MLSNVFERRYSDLVLSIQNSLFQIFISTQKFLVQIQNFHVTKVSVYHNVRFCMMHHNFSDNCDVLAKVDFVFLDGMQITNWFSYQGTEEVESTIEYQLTYLLLQPTNFKPQHNTPNTTTH